MLVCRGWGRSHFQNEQWQKESEMCWTIMLKQFSGMVHTCIGEGMPKTQCIFFPPVVPYEKKLRFGTSRFTPKMLQHLQHFTNMRLKENEC